MISLQVAALILVVVIVVAGLLWQWYRSHIFKRASGLARRVFPVWAAQGPFETGEESAAAMRYAYLAVFGQEEAERMGMAEAISKHAAAYDGNPSAWEQNRQEAMRSANTEMKEFIRIAKGLAATDARNKNFVGSGSDNLQLAKQSDRSSGALPWSNNPGAHEAHLMRRHNNPYFPKTRRAVSHEDLEEAKKKDKDEYILCQRRLEELGQEIEALPEAATSGDLMALRERIDDLIFFSMGVGGPATEIASKADQLREAVISDLRSAFAGDEETISNIEKADTYHKDNVRKFYIPVIAQMRRENSPILEEETIATVLSEDPSSIAIFMNCLPEDSRALIEVEGLKMLQETLGNGHIDPQCEEKIFALGGEWPISQK